MVDSAGDDRWSLLAADLGIGDTASDGAAAAPPAGDAPPKRRRRRRSRKPGSGEGNPGEPLEGGADIIDPGESLDPTGNDETTPDGTTKKRRRRRSRRNAGDDNGAGGVESVVVVEADDAGDEAAEPVLVANLPSWQELIDGLYRP